MIVGTIVSVGLGPDEVSPRSFEPSDVECFAAHCFIRVGTTEGLETQDQRLLVCSPTWLVKTQPLDSAIRGQGLLLMQRYDGAALDESLARFVTRCAGATVKEVFERLGRLGFSEFEDYNACPLPQFFIDKRHETETLGTS